MAKSKVEYWLTSDGLTLLEGWARDGLTDEQIMHNMGIQSKSTFYGYKKKYPNISNALKKGKEVADYEVENALFKRALGYTYEEKTYEKVYDKETGLYVERLTKRVTKQVAPDTTAQIYWLNNRKPKQWRNKRDDSQQDPENEGVMIVNDLPKSN